MTAGRSSRHVPSTTRALIPQRLWWRVVVIVIAAFLTYWNSLSAPFVFDDNVAITSNPQIRQLGNLARVLSPERNSPVAGRPIVNLSFAINYAAGALDGRGYHLVNIVIHALVALL